MEEKLINEVRFNREIYDKKSHGYMNSLLKAKIWQEIAQKVGSTDEICLKMWKSLRDKFRKELKKQNTPSGSGFVGTKHWEFFESLSFLKDHMLPNKTRGNFGLQPEMQQSSCSTDTQSFDDMFDTIIEETPSSSDTQRTETEVTQQTEAEATAPKSPTVSEEEESFYTTAERSTPASTLKRKRPSLASDIKEINKAFIKTLGSFQGYLDNSKKDSTPMTPMTEDDTFGKTVSAMMSTLNSNNNKKAKAKILNYLSSLQLFESECIDDFIMPNL